MRLGEAIRLLRKKSGQTQGDLAEKTGFSLDSISRWERSERTPNADDLKKLANALGSTVAFLIGETEDPTPQTSSPTRRSQALHDLEQMLKDLSHENPDMGMLLRSTVENWDDLNEHDIKFISDSIAIALGRVSDDLKIRRESKDGRL